MTICISSGGTAFKSRHYSRVQALLEFISKHNLFKEDDTLIIDKFGSFNIESLYIPMSRGKIIWYGHSLKSQIKNPILRGVFSSYSIFKKIIKKTLSYHLCIASMIQGGMVGLLLKELGKIKYLFYDDMDFYPLFYDGITKATIMHLEKLILKSANLVFSVSYTLKKLREKQGIKNVFWLPNGVDNKLFLPAWLAKRNKIPDKKVVLIYSGSLDPRIWGTMHILKVLREVKKYVKAKLIVIGGGEYLSYLKRYSRKIGVYTDVVFTGKIPHNDIPKFFSKSHIGLAIGVPKSPAEFADPIKIKEYMAAGLPVVGTNIGDIPIIIKNSNAGYAPKFDIEAVASAILSIIERKKYREFSYNARRYAENFFDWNIIFKKLFEKIINYI